MSRLKIGLFETCNDPTSVKILISSHFFHPQVGGTETVGRLLAEEFFAAGHEVKVVTQTPKPGQLEAPIEILRRPTASELLNAVRWCDLYFHNNISLQTAWPLLLVRRPWVVASHTWIPRRRDLGIRAGLYGALKRLAIRASHAVSISRALAADFSTPSVLIPNPYQDDVFRLYPGISRDRDLICAARFVSEKGVDLLIQALGVLRREHGLNPSLTITGSGPEEAALRELARGEAVEEQIAFAGIQTGDGLARLFNGHRVAVIPSRCAETFGLVALESAACGCLVIGSARGGLPEAIGPCGQIFPTGDVAALAEQIAEAVREPVPFTGLSAEAEDHLARHRRANVAAAYLKLMAELLEGRR